MTRVISFAFISIYLTINFFPQYRDKEISSSTECGKYKNLGNCLLLAEKHRSSIHSKILISAAIEPNSGERK